MQLELVPSVQTQKKKTQTLLDSKLFLMHKENLCIRVAGWF